MPVTEGTILFLALFGGLVAIDGTSVGQIMISRPFVAATLAGLIVGDPLQGAMIGLVLEAFHLPVLPVGAAKYPEGGPAAAAAGAVFAVSDGAASTLLLVAVSALALEWLGGESIRILRQVNTRMLRHDSGVPRDASRLEWRHRAAVALDFLRGILLVLVGLVVLFGVASVLAPHWGLGERAAEIMIAASVTAMIAGSVRMVGFRIWYAAAGAAAGAALLFFIG